MYNMLILLENSVNEELQCQNKGKELACKLYSYIPYLKVNHLPSVKQENVRHNTWYLAISIYYCLRLYDSSINFISCRQLLPNA